MANLEQYYLPQQDANKTGLTELEVLNIIKDQLQGKQNIIRTGSGGQVFVADKTGIRLGSGTFSSAPFRVDMSGNLTATSATITGTITATAGTIGGFTIGATTITATNLTLTSGAANTANITVGTGSTAGGLNSASVGGDIAIWAGSTFADRATAPFRVSAAGALVATSATVNGSAISANDVFGSGFDGDATISVNTSLTKDTFYNDLTITSSSTLNTSGYRLFVKGTLTINAGSRIAFNGNNGTNGGTATDRFGAAGGAGGSALAAGTLNGSIAGQTGAAGGNGGTTGAGANGSTGSTGTTIATSFAAAFSQVGGVGGAGGTGSGGGGGSGGTAGTTGSITASVTRPYSAALGVLMLDIYSGATPLFFNYNGNAGGASGGGGGGGSGPTNSQGGGGGGGGNGSNGGTVMVAARIIVNAGSIQAVGGNGGTGGNGSPSTVGDCGGGGGGGGGSPGAGGIIVLIYSSLTGAGTVSVAAGTVGARGNGAAGNGTGTAGSDGVAAAAGAAGGSISLPV